MDTISSTAVTTSDSTISGAVLLPVAQASSDLDMIAIWLDSHRSPHTRRGYAADVAAFQAFSGKPLRQVTVRDLQAFGASLTTLATATAARRLSAIKSLIAFAHRLGYLPFDVGAPVQLPHVEDTLAERIVSESEVFRLIDGATTSRDIAMLRLMYYAALRISEVCGLCWRNLTPRGESGQITVFGKGGKTRAIVLPGTVWRDLMALRATVNAGADEPVFQSRSGGGALDPSQVHRIVKAAAARAGLPDAVSAHWLRHAHVSHALRRRAPTSVVMATAGHASLATTTRYTHVLPDDSSALYLAE
jgi:integrase/recombinase XerD